MAFQRATRAQSRARVAISGPPKAGKTKTGLRLAMALAQGDGDKVAAIDTEYGSMSKYAGEDSGDGYPLSFFVEPLFHYDPKSYMKLIHEAEQAKMDVIFIDSLSHAWAGVGGVLQMVDQIGGNSFTDGWKKATPHQRALVDTILGTPLHVVATMRTKIDYVLETNRHGKLEPKKVGTKIIQREGVEYEFDMLLSVNVEHEVRVVGSRCTAMDGLVAEKPGVQFFQPYLHWLGIGDAVKLYTAEEFQALVDSAGDEDALAWVMGHITPQVKMLTRPDLLATFRHAVQVRRQQLKEEAASRG